jgi:hypothetical protein
VATHDLARQLMPFTLLANGRTSAYGFACGYQDIENVGTIQVSMYQEHGCYHVRSYDHATHQRIAWHSTRELGRARALFHDTIREAKRLAREED